MREIGGPRLVERSVAEAAFGRTSASIGGTAAAGPADTRLGVGIVVAIGERDAAERGTGLLQTSIDCEHLSLQQALAWHGTLTVRSATRLISSRCDKPGEGPSVAHQLPSTGETRRREPTRWRGVSLLRQAGASAGRATRVLAALRAAPPRFPWTGAPGNTLSRPTRHPIAVLRRGMR